MKINKIALFTASACPTGRNIGTVLKEVGADFPEIACATYYVDIHVAETNRYQIKSNPTIVFLDEKGQKLYQLEGFRETDEIKSVISMIEQDNLSYQGEVTDNQPSEETYTVFLYRGAELVPLEVTYQNLTSVKTPRITAIQMLLQSHVAGMENPFPNGTRLELVEFNGPKGKVHLQMTAAPSASERERMHAALTNTLMKFGVTEVEIV